MNYRILPKIDKLLLALTEKFPVAQALLLKNAARETVDFLRLEIGKGHLNNLDEGQLFAHALEISAEKYMSKNTPNLRRVINASGIVLHTNLGRSVLAEDAVKAINEIAANYSNLELSLDNGKRSSRYDHVRELICLLTGAEDALVVNNNAAAVMLMLDSLAKGGEAIVSRGELVEIGGAFRVPDIMNRTGVSLREIGCTNKTHLADYQAALNEQTKVLLKVHPSNYKMIGFTADVDLADLAQLAAQAQVPLLYDLGGGCLYPLAEQGVGNEPMVGQILKTGVDIVSFSGDKLLGGPQAGIIIGRKDLIAKMKANHLTRALRVDKFTLAALEATLRIYLDIEQAAQKIPTLAMLLAKPADLEIKAQQIVGFLSDLSDADIAIENGFSEVGGGSLPGEILDTVLLTIRPKSLKIEDFVAKLRCAEPAVLAYIRDNKAIFDLRTINQADLVELAAIIKQSIL